jgi:hypothetical protein
MLAHLAVPLISKRERLAGSLPVVRFLPCVSRPGVLLPAKHPVSLFFPIRPERGQRLIHWGLASRFLEPHPHLHPRPLPSSSPFNINPSQRPSTHLTTARPHPSPALLRRPSPLQRVLFTLGAASAKSNRSNRFLLSHTQDPDEALSMSTQHQHAQMECVDRSLFP